MVMKKIFKSRFLNGLRLFFSLWWNFELVRIIFVRKVLSVVDKFISIIRKLMLIMISKVRVVYILCRFVLLMKWNMGCMR